LNKNIIIKKSDKVNSIVILNQEDYIKKVELHHKNEKCYIELPYDPPKIYCMT